MHPGVELVEVDPAVVEAEYSLDPGGERFGAAGGRQLGRGQHGGLLELQFEQANFPAERGGRVEQRVDPAGL